MLGGLAFHLLYRWDLTDEPFPDFERRAAWYDTRLIKGSDRAGGRGGAGGRTAAFSYNL